MNAVENAGTPGPESARKSTQRIWLRQILLSVWLVLLMVRVALHHPAHFHRTYLWLLAFPTLPLILLLLAFRPVARWTLGNFRRMQISDPEFEQKMRTRYTHELTELGSLGFDCAFFYGESFSIFRFIFIFPAIVTFSMWRRRVVMTLYEGTQVLNGNPVLVSRDKRAFAHPNGLGMTFHTTFRDGSVLASKTYGDQSDPSAPQVTTFHYKDASISECWAQHQRSISQLETAANPVERQSTFDAYRETILKEEALS